MKYLSVCSGVGTDHVAWEGLGWECVGFSEIEPFASAILAHRYPGVRNYGDFTTIPADIGPIDLLVGGTPCQSFSIAGQRAGLDDPRGNLTLEFARLARRVRARWVVWENVPGVLSSDGGRDFASILTAFRECGYSVCYRVLDAQHYGVPQRRRRVFVVGYLGDDWRPSAAVLFEQASMRGDSPKGRPARQEVAGTPCGGPRSRGSSEPDQVTFIPVAVDASRVNGCLTTTYGSKNYSNHEEVMSGSLVSGVWTSALLNGYVPEIAPCLMQDCGTKLRSDQLALVEGVWWDGGNTASTIDSTSNDHRMPDKGRFTAVIQPLPLHLPLAVRTAQTGANGIGVAEDVAHTLDGTQGQAIALNALSTVVRRLTPRECERLQGLPDDWTLVPYRGKPAADAPRYKAIGNGMAMPVLRWIGQRIAMVEGERNR